MQASSSETAESKASPGFFSQMFSELAAPLYEEDEQDFLSEDREPENPSQEDEMQDDDQADAVYETSNGEDDEPIFASPQFEKSVTENVNSARTAEEETNFGGATESETDQTKGEDQPLPNASKEGNVSGSLPHSSVANAENENAEFPDTHTGEPDVGINSRLDDQPIFAPPQFEKSVTENVNSARTAEEETNFGGATESETDQTKGEDQPLPNASKEGNVSGSLPHSSVANAENENAEFPDTHTGEPDVGINSRLDERSIDHDRLQAELDAAANTKNESSLEQTDNKEINSQEEAEQVNNNRRQFEQDSTVNSINTEDLNTETSVKEEPAKKEAEIDSADVNRGRQDPEQQELRSADSSAVTRFDKKQPDHEVGAAELSDEALKHLRVKSKPSQVEVPSDALEEEEQDLRKNSKEEADEQEEEQDLRKNNKEEADKQEEEQDLRKNNKGEADEQETKERMEEEERKFRLEKEKRDAENKKKAMEEQTRKLMLEKEKRIAEAKKNKKKAMEEQSRNLRLEENGDAEKEKKALEEQTRKLMLEKEKRIAEDKKKVMEEQARKVRLEEEKEKKAADEEKRRKKEEQRKEEARQLRLESLKKQRQQIEETEKMEMERLRREEKKEISLKQQSGAERKEEEVDDKAPEDERIDQEKVNPTQEKRKTSEDHEDEEHMKIKGAFDQKMAEEEAAWKRRLQMLSEERRNFEKMAEEYQVSKKERQQKEQKAKKMSTKHSAESDLRKAATAVSPSSKQVKTSHHQGWYTDSVEMLKHLLEFSLKGGHQLKNVYFDFQAAYFLLKCL